MYNTKKKCRKKLMQLVSYKGWMDVGKDRNVV